MDERHDVLLVGVNTDKHEAYALKRDKQIVRVCLLYTSDAADE